MIVPLQLVGDDVQHVGMRLGINLATQDFFCALDCQIGHLTAQTFLGAVYFLLDFSLGASQYAISLSLGTAFGFFDDFAGTLFGMRNDFRSFFLGAVQFLSCALGRQLQLMLAAISSRKPVGNLLLAGRQRSHDGWPYKLHAEPYEHDEHDRLAEKGCINVHANTFP
jgi:hypothetical protein